MSGGEEKETKVSNLKPGMDNVEVKVRVLEVGEPKVITTRRGERTIREAVVGDETGRVRMTIWGYKDHGLHKGQAVKISGAWTTSYRGNVVLNIGTRTKVEEVDSSEVAEESEIPETTPKAPRQYRGGGGYRSRRSYGGRRGGVRRHQSGY